MPRRGAAEHFRAVRGLTTHRSGGGLYGWRVLLGGGGRVGDGGERGQGRQANQRIATILDATGRCVARFGVEGTTLERVAAESGLSRSRVRHYVGNRADLIGR